MSLAAPVDISPKDESAPQSAELVSQDAADEQARQPVVEDVVEADAAAPKPAPIPEFPKTINPVCRELRLLDTNLAYRMKGMNMARTAEVLLFLDTLLARISHRAARKFEQ